MNILFITHAWFDNQQAGGERYAYELAKYLISQGNEVKALVYGVEEHEFEGVEIIPQVPTHQLWEGNNDVLEWCDIAITQLLSEPFGYNKAYIQHKKPLVIIAHNSIVPSLARYNSDVHFILNTETAKEALQYTQNQIVLHPPVNYKDYKPGVLKSRKFVTLVNCNANKGGQILIDLAKAMPDVQFLGVLGGYDTQIMDLTLPNLSYQEQTLDIESILKETKVLIMPSIYESYGQIAAEAACMGVPVVATDLAGVRECLGDAGVYIKTGVELESAVAALVSDDKLYKKTSDAVLARAKEFEPTAELEAAEQWLIEVAQTGVDVSLPTKVKPEKLS